MIRRFIRKKISRLLFGFILAAGVLGNKAYADSSAVIIPVVESSAETATETASEDVKYGDIVMSSYAYYEKTPYDDMLTDWMNRYEELVKPEGYSNLYTGTKAEIYDIYYTFLIRFGYSYNIRLMPLKFSGASDKYGISFEPDSDPKGSLAVFMDEFEKTKAAAADSKGNTVRETADKAYACVSSIAPYLNYDYNNNEDQRVHTYGGFSGIPQLCEGKGTMLTRLCYMNGIKCENPQGTVGGIEHWWNRITTEQGEIWYDSARHKVSAELPGEYVLTSYAEVGK